MQAQLELQRDLVLVGGGHAHALALRMLAMDPIAGLRITLVSPASHTPYSGMLPGLVAGHYRFEETHIDLARLCQWAGARFIAAEVTGIDLQRKTLQLAGRPALEYDVASLDIGSQPELASVPGAGEYATPVKPVAGLWQRWQQLYARLAQDSQRALQLAIVGGGAGSVELALAMAHSQRDRGGLEFTLYCGAAEILQGYNARARAGAMDALRAAGVAVQLDCRVSSVAPGTLAFADGGSAAFDELFWCTGAAAAPWLAASGLPCDEQGFLQVTDTLQAIDHPDLFGAGDIATQVNHPRPKAGVYAVRQAPVLAHNLRAQLLGRPLREHRPQQRFLSLVSLGGRDAVADKGPFSARGGWVWRWKDRIDREFMGRFEALPAMPVGGRDSLPGALDPNRRIHCGGCGAKVGARGLAAALATLAQEFPGQCLPAGAGDDASALPVPADGVLLQSLDLLRQLVGDPWLMGRIAANHALSDLYACGGRPLSALAAVTLSFARASLLERDLQQLLRGAMHEFSRVGCRLDGGHSMQGPELQLGFAVTGVPLAPQRGVLAKRGARPGDALVLTKPLGTGVLFAAHMALKADGRDIAAATDSMLLSNQHAAELALAHNASAATDVTGFGLGGHLLEMLGDSLQASLEREAIPLLPGVAALWRQGVRSTGHEANAAQLGDLDAVDAALLADPQTSGGLLVALPAAAAAAYCAALNGAGCGRAAVIGAIADRAGVPITLR